VPHYILGISAWYHDSAAALISDGQIIAAAQEERFTRIKHDPSFPVHAIRYVLNEAGIDPGSISQVAFYEKPLIKFERLLETYHAFAPRGMVSFIKAMPVWIKEKLFMSRMLKRELKDLGMEQADLRFPEHHLSHAASAFYPSPFSEAAILTIDGVGEWATTTISIGKGHTVRMLKELNFPHSLGLLYSAFTYYCGFKVNSGEYKLMGLAPYGQAGTGQTLEFVRMIKEKLVDIRDDGSILLNMDYFQFATGLRMTNDKKWAKLFGIPPRQPEEELTPVHMNLALAIQLVTEEIFLRLAQTAKAITGCENLTLAGGVALNCVANGKLSEAGIFKNLWIQPAAGDAGGSVGAALAAWHIGMDKPRSPQSPDAMKGACLGPEFPDKEIRKVAARYDAPGDRFINIESLAETAAGLIGQGNVIGWFQGRMEFGPRALGNRSILGDARNPGMQKRMNLKIKFREGFRPFAPVVPVEDANEYFDLKQDSPYMLLVAKVRDEIRKPLPADSESRPLLDRLYLERSSLPAITHIDYSARVQTVSRETNYPLWKLLQEFKKLTGTSVLVNTSFNVRGEPIVCSPEEAFRCFMRTDMDYLVMGNYLFDKKMQPAVLQDLFRESFEKD
jgi:carbamoyltransferase